MLSPDHTVSLHCLSQHSQCADFRRPAIPLRARPSKLDTSSIRPYPLLQTKTTSLLELTKTPSAQLRVLSDNLAVSQPPPLTREPNDQAARCRHTTRHNFLEPDNRSNPSYSISDLLSNNLTARQQLPLTRKLDHQTAPCCHSTRHRLLEHDNRSNTRCFLSDLLSEDLAVRRRSSLARQLEHQASPCRHSTRHRLLESDDRSNSCYSPSRPPKKHNLPSSHLFPGLDHSAGELLQSA